MKNNVHIMKVNNTPIDDLIKQYEEECCDFSNIDFLINASRRCVETMGDEQVRCLLHAMANELEKQKNNWFLKLFRYN